MFAPVVYAGAHNSDGNEGECVAGEGLEACRPGQGQGKVRCSLLGGKGLGGGRGTAFGGVALHEAAVFFALTHLIGVAVVGRDHCHPSSREDAFDQPLSREVHSLGKAMGGLGVGRAG
jgi:hypothetical protein